MDGLVDNFCFRDSRGFHFVFDVAFSFGELFELFIFEFREMDEFRITYCTMMLYEIYLSIHGDKSAFDVRKSKKWLRVQVLQINPLNCGAMSFFYKKSSKINF